MTQMITKSLKNYTFEFDEDKKELILIRNLYGVSDEIVFEMDKTRMFSLFRFLVRISQKISSRKRTKHV
jgi:hypothetical protein